MYSCALSALTTTVSRSLLEWLHYKLDAHFYYMGSGEGAAGWVQGVRRVLSRFWRKRKGPRTVNSAKTEGQKSASALSKLWRSLDLLLLRRKLRLLRHNRRPAARHSCARTAAVASSPALTCCQRPRHSFPCPANGLRATAPSAQPLATQPIPHLPNLTHTT